MSNNDQEESRKVVLGLLKFIGSSIITISVIINIATVISKTRSPEPTYIATIPPTTHTSSPKQSSIIPESINYSYYDGSVISTEHKNSTDQLIISARFINMDIVPETAELQLLIDGMVVESKTTTLNQGEVYNIFITIPPVKSWNVNPTAIALPLSPTKPGMI